MSNDAGKGSLQRPCNRERYEANYLNTFRKLCSTCGESKPKDSFSIDKSTSSGLRGRCRECHEELHLTLGKERT